MRMIFVKLPAGVAKTIVSRPDKFVSMSRTMNMLMIQQALTHRLGIPVAAFSSCKLPTSPSLSFGYLHMGFIIIDGFSLYCVCVAV